MCAPSEKSTDARKLNCRLLQSSYGCSEVRVASGQKLGGIFVRASIRPVSLLSVSVAEGSQLIGPLADATLGLPGPNAVCAPIGPPTPVFSLRPLSFRT